MIGMALGGTAATAAAGWLLYPRVRPSSSSEELEVAEAALLERMRGAGVHVEQRMVGLAGSDSRINTVIVRRHDRPQPPAVAAQQRTLVLVHGLGGGIGLWSKNLVELAEHFDVVYAFDLLGFGRSSRPVAPRGSPVDVQRWWVASVEDWRAAVGIEQPFEICGHSLGAFVAASYTAAHSARISRLVLAAPVGLHDMAERLENLSPRFRRILQTVLFLGLNRTRIIGLLGPYQSSYLRKVLEDRGPRWYGMDEPTREYTYHLQLTRDLPWSERVDAGDAAFSRFLSLESGWLQPLTPDELRAMRDVPTDILYGEIDFIPTGGAARMKEALGGGCRAWVIPEGNHHFYARNAGTFNRLVAGLEPRAGEAHPLPEPEHDVDRGGAVVGGLTGPDAARDRSPSPSPKRSQP